VFPEQRPRRLRRTPALRRLVAETSLEPRQLVLPMFVKEGAAEPVPITSMPGVVSTPVTRCARGRRSHRSGYRRRDAFRDSG
jgi:delta-aminolevulinic acid dehydratase/porphobilinogen synthase